MSEIRVKEGESLESALRRFKRSTARSGVLAEVRKREAYEKPSVKRKKKSEAARKRKFKFEYLTRNDCADPRKLRGSALLFLLRHKKGFPLWGKLSPQVTDEGEIAAVAKLPGGVGSPRPTSY